MEERGKSNLEIDKASANLIFVSQIMLCFVVFSYCFACFCCFPKLRFCVMMFNFSILQFPSPRVCAETAKFENSTPGQKAQFLKTRKRVQTSTERHPHTK